MQTQQTLINWLMDGDVSIQYQTKYYLLGDDDSSLQARISKEGWGARFLAQRNKTGHWGQRFYQPKWISSHYTLLDLKYLAIDPTQKECRETIAKIAQEEKAADGGINPAVTVPNSDVCLNGMFLNYACYFGIAAVELQSIIDFILTQQMSDGGFNCESNQRGARHSSLHTTISMLEGFHEYRKNGYNYRIEEIDTATKACHEFILMHKLFRSDRTNQIIDKRFLRLSYPSRWRYDILRALVYFADAKVPFDPRMQEAIDVLKFKQRKNETWPVQEKHAGQTHFDMEKTGGPSRWNTLRALRVLKEYA